MLSDRCHNRRKALTWEQLWFAGIGMGDKKNLQSMAVALKKEWERLKKEGRT
jgi:hypothetical protein